MKDFSKKADDLLERFMIITNTVGTQIQGMNSSIVKLHETNEKMKVKTNSVRSMKGSWIWKRRYLTWTQSMKTEAKTTSEET